MLKDKPLKILITNDDGINSKGIAILHKIASEIGECTVVCPSADMSCVSKCMLLAQRNIFIEKGVLTSAVSKNVFSCTGTPADCIVIALESGKFDKPDVVVSGINRGLNIGYTTAISGTVGAAEIAAALGIKSLSFSYETSNESGFSEESILKFKSYFQGLIHGIATSKTEDGVIINVSIPKHPKGSSVSFQSKCWIGPNITEENGGYISRSGKLLKLDAVLDGDDYSIVKKSLIAITPIKMGNATCMSSYKSLQKMHADVLLVTED